MHLRILTTSLIILCFCTRALAISCTTQAQMTAAQRNGLSDAAKTMMGLIQRGDLQGLRANTLPSVASDFSGIASTVANLKPQIQTAMLTVENVYLLDASGQVAGSAPTEFFCGQPVVSLNFGDLPAGMYALAIGHATGVPQPQQVALILAKAPSGQWVLGGLFAKPMLYAGHGGLWYWTSARKYAAGNQEWGAWLDYSIAKRLLNPLDIMSTPNLEKLQQESEKVKPANLPGPSPVLLSAHAGTYSLTAIDTTTEFGALDLDVHYTPDAAQAQQLRDPPAARKQVLDIMGALLEQHPELHQVFHGIWVQADQGAGSLFALELPMDSIRPN